MARLKPTGAVLLTALACSAAACGGSDDDGSSSASTQKPAEAKTPEQQIRATYAALTDAIYAKNAGKACSLMTESVQRKVGNGKSCVATMKVILRNDPSPNRPYISKLKVNGATASAKVKTKTSLEYPLPFEKVDGEWKASGGVPGS